MKTPFTLTKTLGFFITLMVFALSTNSVNAQDTEEKTIKGIVSSEIGPLERASVLLKGTTIGTITNEKGEFTFPRPLKADDILVISYLGFETLEVKIRNTTFLKLVLTEDLLEFSGALNSDKPYKSKRKK